MSKIKFRPVVWLTAVNGVLLAAVGAQAVYPIIPGKVMGIIAFAALATSIFLGKKTFDAVTPLARPRADDGTPLVPSPPAKVPPGTSRRDLSADRLPNRLI